MPLCPHGARASTRSRARGHTPVHTRGRHTRAQHTTDSHTLSLSLDFTSKARPRVGTRQKKPARAFACSREWCQTGHSAHSTAQSSLLKLVARVRSNPQMLQLSTVAPAEQNTQRSPKAWIPSHPWAMERAPELLERADPELVLGLALRRALERATRARSSCTSPAQALTALAKSGLRFAPSPRSTSASAGSAAAPCRRLD